MTFEEYWENSNIDTSSGDAEWLKGEMQAMWNAAIGEAVREVGAWRSTSMAQVASVGAIESITDAIKELKS